MIKAGYNHYIKSTHNRKRGEKLAAKSSSKNKAEA
jgi:hypothetical protein